MEEARLPVRALYRVRRLGADREWPRYDLNDGMYSGLPKTLRKLWERHQLQIEAALGKEPAHAAMVFESSPTRG